MSKRSWWFALSRPGVWIPWVGGVCLIAADVSLVGGVVLGLFGLAKLRHVLSHRDLDQRLRLKGEKQQHRIDRRLGDGERSEVLALDSYCAELRQAGASAALCEEVKDAAWKILGNPSSGDTVARLRRLRQGLPALLADAPRAAPDSTLGQRIQEELNLLRVTRKEVELVG